MVLGHPRGRSPAGAHPPTSALATPASPKASHERTWYSGSHTAGPAALPANFHAPMNETAPARLLGAARTAIVWTPAKTSPAPPPPASHVAASDAGAPTMPSSGTR